MKNITIPKRIVSKKHGLILTLNEAINAVYFETQDQYEVKSSRPSFLLFIDKEEENDSVAVRIREKIIEIYYQGISDINSLNSYEMNIFYFIKNIHNKNANKSNTLIIGYKDNYIADIQATTLKFNTACDNIEFKQNLELYQNNEFKNIYNKLIEKISKNKYNKFIIDITNIFITGSDYKKTKSIIQYIEQQIHGEVLFLVEPNYCALNKFVEIFGEKYKDKTIFKDNYIHPGKLILGKIKHILCY